MIVWLTTYCETGDVKRVISCPREYVGIQKLRPGEQVIEGKADATTQKIVDGKIVDKTVGEIAAFNAKSKHLRFDTGKKKPVADLEKIEESKSKEQ